MPIKQIFVDKKCLGCVAAMVTHTTLKDFENFLIEGKMIYYFISILPPWTNIELNAYLLLFGLKIGQTYYLRNKNFSLDAAKEIVQSLISIRNQPAVVTVKSENYQNSLHAIYWSGDQIYDPNPNVLDGQTFNGLSNSGMVANHTSLKL